MQTQEPELRRSALAVSRDGERAISIRGARVHNLKNVDVDIPHGRLVVITGVSGSGKSSLAFDTLHAEGQRRYLESLSRQARDRLLRIDRPDVDSIDQLPPTVCVDQRVGITRIRSTLGTTTEIYDYLRLLYARAGQAHCPDCHVPVAEQSIESIVQRIVALEERRKVMILAPLVIARKGAHRDLFDKINKAGFVRARVDGEIVAADNPPDLDRSIPHTIEAVVDRIIVKPDIENRLTESVSLALKYGAGSCLISDLEDAHWRDQLYSSKFCCPSCGVSFPSLETRTFRFNSPYGACPSCRGLGQSLDVDAGPHENWSDQTRCPDCHGTRLAPFGRAVRFNGLSISELTNRDVRQAIEFISRSITKLPALNDRQSELPSVDRAGGPDPHLGLQPQQIQAAKSILPDVLARLEFLMQVGLDYLTLDRPTPTLSGGEFQRARLACSLGAGLVGVCYVLDEPTVGLHTSDTNRILDVLRRLRDDGNSVVVVEHDEEIMREADFLIDVGPGAGSVGGEIVATLNSEQIQSCQIHSEQSSHAIQSSARLSKSETLKFLRSTGSWNPKKAKARGPAAAVVRVDGCHRNNLRRVTAEFPLERLTVVHGRSGSGKSSLVTGTLVPAVRFALASRNRDVQLDLSGRPEIECDSIEGFDSIHRLAVVDQSPIGRSSRSNPATHTGLWGEVRRLFAKTRDARLRGFKSKRFSFNSKEGNCSTCQGHGVERVSFAGSATHSAKASNGSFLPDHFVECITCRGARFNWQTLQVRYRKKNIADVLAMSVTEASEFFINIPKVSRILKTLDDVGLGYLQLGQPATTLSGGEAQRLKLGTELSKTSEHSTMFVLDEPTTGLHPVDVQRLLAVLDRLVNQGNTVIVVEHHSHVIQSADWSIELGPGAGSQGGEIVAMG